MNRYKDEWLTIYGGDCREVLRSLPAESVHCCVTSPPYWGLRDYGTASWEGGDEGCDHRPPSARRGVERRASTLGGGVAHITAQDEGRTAVAQCPRCGARRIDSQLGLEPTPEPYVENMVAVFREVRRVLRDDGTLWLNLGDSYAGSGKGPEGGLSAGQTFRVSISPRYDGLKPKDLVGIPWRVAFALQADGWYLRSDIIWAKPNPMPESVTDRPTKSHEYLFLLAKSPRYYFDADAVREAISPYNNGKVSVAPHGEHVMESGHRKQEWREYDTIKGANIRSVWNIATRPYAGAHFAVFPPEIPERCIKAGTSGRGVCPECGAPWRRVVEVERGERDDSTRDPAKAGARKGMAAVPEKGWETERTTVRWESTCKYDQCRTGLGEITIPKGIIPEPVPAVILDPFAGSGTVGMVAQRLSRRAVLIDLNPDYIEQQLRRNQNVPLGLAG